MILGQKLSAKIVSEGLILSGIMCLMAICYYMTYIRIKKEHRSFYIVLLNKTSEIQNL